MPIFVQWKWEEPKKSFLVVFRFYDDYSKRNLRLKKRTFIGNPKKGYTSFPQPPIHIPEYEAMIRKTSKDLAKFGMLEKKQQVLTWAPNISEMGYLIEVLIHAFIVNGLGEVEKRELRAKLEVVDIKNGIEGDSELIDEVFKEMFDSLNVSRIEDKTPLDTIIFRKKSLDGFDFEKSGEVDQFHCFELCPEYIDYLKKLLKPYIDK